MSNSSARRKAGRWCSRERNSMCKENRKRPRDWARHLTGLESWCVMKSGWRWRQLLSQLCEHITSFPHNEIYLKPFGWWSKMIRKSMHKGIVCGLFNVSLKLSLHYPSQKVNVLMADMGIQLHLRGSHIPVTNNNHSTRGSWHLLNPKHAVLQALYTWLLTISTASPQGTKRKMKCRKGKKLVPGHTMSPRAGVLPRSPNSVATLSLHSFFREGCSHTTSRANPHLEGPEAFIWGNS